ncbi:hypothetical protein PENTCL1PPCAC_25241, partial [Pristionchus entomophagus]
KQKKDERTKVPGEVVGYTLKHETEPEEDDPDDRIQIGPIQNGGREVRLDECHAQHEEARLDHLGYRLGSGIGYLSLGVCRYVRSIDEMDVVCVEGERTSEDGLEVKDV